MEIASRFEASESICSDKRKPCIHMNFFFLFFPSSFHTHMYVLYFEVPNATRNFLEIHSLMTLKRLDYWHDSRSLSLGTIYFTVAASYEKE